MEFFNELCIGRPNIPAVRGHPVPLKGHEESDRLLRIAIRLADLEITYATGTQTVHDRQNLSLNLHIGWLILRFYGVEILLEADDAGVELFIRMQAAVINPQQLVLACKITLIKDGNI